MGTIMNTQECFRSVLGSLSVDELVGNKQLQQKIERINSLFIQLISREEK